MKLQYIYFESLGFKYIIRLYYNGWLVKSYKVWSCDLNDEIEKIEKQGYKRGYTAEEVERAKQCYEHMLENVVVEKDR